MLETTLTEFTCSSLKLNLPRMTKICLNSKTMTQALIAVTEEGMHPRKLPEVTEQIS